MKTKEENKIAYQSAAVMANPKIMVNGVIQLDLFDTDKSNTIEYSEYGRHKDELFTENVCGIAFDSATDQNTFLGLIRFMGIQNRNKVDEERAKKRKIQMVSGNIPFSESIAYENEDYITTKITMGELCNLIFGKGKWGGTQIKAVANSLNNIFNKYFPFTCDGRKRVIAPILLASCNFSDERNKRNGEDTEIIYLTHYFFVVSLAYNGIRESENLYAIIRGNNISSWANRFLLAMIKMANDKSKCKEPFIYHKSAISFEDEFILTPKEKKSCKKDPKRKMKMFYKTINLMVELKLIIEGEHEEKIDDEIVKIKDNGFYIVNSEISHEPVYYFRINPDFPRRVENGDFLNQ